MIKISIPAIFVVVVEQDEKNEDGNSAAKIWTVAVAVAQSMNTQFAFHFAINLKFEFRANLGASIMIWSEKSYKVVDILRK